jgi:RNA polymerase sigma-70 factor (ECF subfamily)
MFYDNLNRKSKFEEISKPIMLDLYKHIKLIVKNSTLADDVFQNSLLIAYEKLDSLRDESKFKSWVFKIATNECFRVLKEQKKETPIEKFFDDIEELKDTDSVELLIILKDDKKNVMKAIKNLSYNQRCLIVMIYYLGLDYKEISKLLSVEVNALRVQHHRIINKLRNMLKGEM